MKDHTKKILSAFNRLAKKDIYEGGTKIDLEGVKKFEKYLNKLADNLNNKKSNEK